MGWWSEALKIWDPIVGKYREYVWSALEWKTDMLAIKHIPRYEESKV